MYRDGLVGDLHSHALMQAAYLGKKLNRKQKPPLFWNPLRSQIDLDKLCQAGVDIQVFTIYLPFKYPWPDFYTGYQAMMKIFRKLMQNGKDKTGHARNAEEAESLIKQKKIAAVVAVEGGHLIDGRLERLEQMKRDGVLYITLTHFIKNRIAQACTFKFFRDEGLTGFGKETLQEMERLGIAPDTAHLSDKAFNDVVKYTKGPLICSHTGLRKLCRIERNLTDDGLKAIAERNGMAGIVLFTSFLKKHALFLSPEAVIDHMRHAVETAGDEHVGIGTDFDGMILTPKGLHDMSRLPRLLEMIHDEFPGDAARKICGNNILRFIRIMDGSNSFS